MRHSRKLRLGAILALGATAVDPSDDVFLAEELVKGSTGRNDDFWGTVVPALS